MPTVCDEEIQNRIIALDGMILSFDQEVDIALSNGGFHNTYFSDTYDRLKNEYIKIGTYLMQKNMYPRDGRDIGSKLMRLKLICLRG